MPSSWTVFGTQSGREAFPDRASDEQTSDRVLSTNTKEGRKHSEDYLANLLNFYAALAVKHAVVEEIEPSSWFASIKELRGVFGEGSTAEEALSDLKESIPGWVSLGLKVGADDIPVMEGFDVIGIYRRGHGKTAKADFKE